MIAKGAIKIVARKIVKENEVGKIDAMKTMAMILDKECLVSEFASYNVINHVLK